MISVFTPTHDSRWLNDCYESLMAQTHEKWEWVILRNGAIGNVPPLLGPWDGDVRVRIYDASAEITGVGALKAVAVAFCQGDILVELDHDDKLLPSALEEIVKAFELHPDAGLVYSQCANIDTDGKSIPLFFPRSDGWKHRSGSRQYPLSMAPTPHNVSHIWWAPNHVRAFSRVAYDKAGGYNPQLDILDDQDLMSRLYSVGEFVLIDKCLYLQRHHADRTSAGPMDAPQTENNRRIQVETVQMYDRTIEQAALAWAERKGMPCLDLGGAHGERDPRYLSVDQHEGLNVSIKHTFPAELRNVPIFDSEDRAGLFSGEDSSIGVIRAVDFLEHVYDKVAMMNEIYRLLAPGGMLLSETPSTDGRGAFQDPTHVAFWNSNSFWYYTDPNLAKYVPEITAKFQVSRLLNYFPTPWHEQHNIVYVKANLITVKDGMERNGGPCHWAESN